jgi:hypothetical protein
VQRPFFAVVEAPSGEGTALGQHGGTGRVTWQDNTHPLPRRIGDRDADSNRHGIGVARAGDHRFDVTVLDDATEVHHGDAMRDLADHGEVVRDEEIGETPVALELEEEVEHLGLHRHIEADTGSSHTRKAGSTASARAMPIRWRCPPENSWG